MALRRPYATASSAWAVLVAGAPLLICSPSAQGEPVPLPYRSQAPFIPTVDLFGGPNKGLILGAEEADRGRPAPVTIGNTTFFPQVRRAGETYGGYTRVDGDLQITHGDLYLNNQPVGATLQQDANTLQQQGASINQLQQSSAVDHTTLQQHETNLNTLNTAAAQSQQAIQQLNQSVNTLDQTAQQHTTTLQQHATVMSQHAATLLQQGAAIDGLSVEMTGVKQSISTLDQNLNNLGKGVAGATALASALASLPVDSGQSPLSCGLGSGGYSNRYALAMGCSVNLTSSLSLNAGGAYLFGGGSSYGGGSLSDVAGRFGLSYRFGKPNSGTVVAARAQDELESELRALKEKNLAMQALLVGLEKRMDGLQDSALKKR